MWAVVVCVVWVVDAEAEVEEEDLDECFAVWCFVVLYGFAGGARFIEPSDFAGFGAVCFFVVVAVSTACNTTPVERARRRSDLEMRRSNIYCTPMGFAAVSG